MALVASCSTNKTEQMNGDLVNKWELASIDGESVSFETPITLEFDKENQVSGYMGCNRAFGSYSLEKNSKIKFEKLGTTLMMCEDEMMKIEEKVVDIIEKADSYELTPNQLILKSKDSNLVFNKSTK